MSVAEASFNRQRHVGIGSFGFNILYTFHHRTSWHMENEISLFGNVKVHQNIYDSHQAKPLNGFR